MNNFLNDEKVFRAACVELIEYFINEEKNIHRLDIQNLFNSETSLLKTSLSPGGKGLSQAVHDLKERVLPYLIKNYSSRFFNWVVGGRTPASVLGDFYTSVVDQIVMLHGHGITTELEEQTLEWLLELFDLPNETFQGSLTTGATEANVCALAAARQWYGRMNHVDVRVSGLYNLHPPTLLASAPHSSIDKALQILGLGRERLLKITSSYPQMDIPSLEKFLQQHQHAIVIANCGEVNTGETDNLLAIANLCQKYQAWLHVDAAFGLFARCSSLHKKATLGIEHADSITCDGHKLGNTPYGCGFLFIQKENYSYLTESFATTASYLATNHDHPMNTRIANSQRFIALPLWLSLLAYGKKGYSEMVMRQCEFARAVGDWVSQQEDYELLRPVSFNIVLFKHKKVLTLEENQHLIRCINATNQLSLSGTVFNSQPSLRIAVANWNTSLESDLQPTCEGLLSGAKKYNELI